VLKDCRIVLFHTDDVNLSRFKDTFPEVEYRSVKSPITGETPLFSGPVSEGMCLRIDAMDQLIAEGIDKVVYSDADALWFKDPALMFDLPVDSVHRFAAVRDMVYQKHPEFKGAYPIACREWAHRQSINDNYFNSGVMVISLKGLSEYLTLLGNQSLTEYVQQNQHRYLFPDQDPLNELGHNRLELPREFNAYIDHVIGHSMLTREVMENRYKISQSAIIHWITMTKPWLHEREPSLTSAAMPHEKYWEAMQPVLEFLDGGFIKAVSIKLRQYAHLVEHAKRDFKDVGGYHHDSYRRLVRKQSVQ
jgi:lipopolysaccharide biosynthesis glycosyltransferase